MRIGSEGGYSAEVSAVPPDSVEIKQWMDPFKEIESDQLTLVRLLLAYISLTKWIWVCLSTGWGVVAISVYTGIEPAASGSVLVVLCIVAETVLMTSHWQDFPTTIGFSHVRVWKQNYNGKQEIIFSTCLLHIDDKQHQMARLYSEKENSAAINLLYVAAGKQHYSQYPVLHKSGTGSSSFWNMTKTIQFVTYRANVCITFSIIIGTLIWGYYDWFCVKFTRVIELSIFFLSRLC